jgi:hypothetical protein
MITFRHLIWTMMAAAGLMLSVSQSFAQKPDVGDQPGLIADDSVELDPEYRRTAVLYRTSEAPGTIIIQTAERHLYLIQGNGRALRYGIGVGRDGFQWQGLVNITRKAEWPDWTPPPEMIARQPYLPRFMAGGPGNPLGARAPRSIASTAPTGRIRSAPRFRPAASGWSMPTSPTSMSACRSAPRSSSGRSRNCNRGAAFSQPIAFPFSRFLARDTPCGHSEAAF